MRKKLPEWLKKRIPSGSAGTENIISSNRLNTVCASALCPNRGECFSKGEATFMILGNVCTRGCGFCGIRKGSPLPVDGDEPSRIAGAVREMGLRYVVITSVTRDDLPDGGAGQFVKVARELRDNFGSGIGIEFLIPDLKGSWKELEFITAQDITVLNHNIETVERLYPSVRQKADYRRSLELLCRSKRHAPGLLTKSGLMLGLGEKEKEVLKVMKDLRSVSCDLLTIGQYLQPGPEQLEVEEYIEPGIFDRYASAAREMGFRGAASGPFVRSSYHAHSLVMNAEL